MVRRCFRLIRNNITLMLVFIILLLFPLLVDLLYHIHFGFFYISESDLLSFYGVALGLFFSFVIYHHEKKKEIISHNLRLKPYIAVDITTNDESGCFELTLTKLSESIISDVFVFDKLFSNKLVSEQRQLVSFYRENEIGKALDLSGYDNDLIDSDGFPKYILISCADAENRMWQGEYIKLSNNNEKKYVLKDFYLV